MNREIVTDPLGAEDLWADLRTNIEFLKASGYTAAMVFFGVGWGGDIYEGQWKDGKPHGMGVMTRPDNTRQAGKYENGEFVGE